MKFKPLYFAISLVVLIPGIYSLIFYGFQPSIDFTGGAMWELKFENKGELNNTQLKSFIEELSTVDLLPQTEPLIAVDEGLEVVEGELEVAEGELEVVLEEQEVAQEGQGAGEDKANILKDITVLSVVPSGDQTFVIKLSPISELQRQELKKQITHSYGEVSELRFEMVGPALGEELLTKTIIAILIASVAIVLYVAYAFKELTYGIAAILAMFHDTLILLGCFSLFGHFLGVEIDALFVAAVLTILSFSVHDTIVVFDRIRESSKKEAHQSFTYLANKAVSETLVRSLNNSFTIIFMLTSLALLGGETIRWFVVALLIGTIAGTYSSTFTAVPLLHTIILRKK